MKDKKALNTSMCAGIVIFAACLLPAFAVHWMAGVLIFEAWASNKAVAFAIHWMIGVLIFGGYGWAWAWASNKAVKDDIAKKQDQKEDEPR